MIAIAVAVKIHIMI